MSIWTRSAVNPSKDWLCRLSEEEAEEEAEEDSSLDMRFDAEKHESHDLPPREDLREREKAKEKKNKYTTNSRSGSKQRGVKVD